MMTFPIYGKNIPNVPNHQSENIWLKDWQKEFLIVQIKAMAGIAVVIVCWLDGDFRKKNRGITIWL
jgi:hypothetical protein